MSMFDDAVNNYTSIANGLGGMWGAFQGLGTANNVNNQVQSGLNQNQSATQAQIDALSQQIAQNRQQAQDMYQRSLADVTGQNSQIEGNIGTLTGNLNALSDPNSAYMQQARQAIERKDAAAGRNSQWGDREVQLAATLADYVGKYAPGLQQSITGARNQINLNNQGLASLYSTANSPADRNTLAQMQALQQQLENIKTANTTGRGSANAATNALTGTGGLINSAGSLIKGLGGLFGGSSGGGSYLGSSGSGGGAGFEGLYGWGGDPGTGLGNGMGFTGGGIDTDYLGLAGNSSLDQGMGGYNPYNFTSTIGGGSGWGAYDEYP